MSEGGRKAAEWRKRCSAGDGKQLGENIQVSSRLRAGKNSDVWKAKWNESAME